MGIGSHIKCSRLDNLQQRRNLSYLQRSWVSQTPRCYLLNIQLEFSFQLGLTVAASSGKNKIYFFMSLCLPQQGHNTRCQRLNRGQEKFNWCTAAST